MIILRACVGFMFFHLAFLLRDNDAGVALFGFGVAMSALGTMAGNAIAPRLRRFLHEETMLIVSLAVTTAAALIAALIAGAAAGIALAVVANFAAAVGRLGFESIVQREAPSANHGRAFARFETKFQFGWAIAGLLPVVIELPGAIGYLIVGLMAGVGLLNYFAAAPARSRCRDRASRRGQPSSGASATGAAYHRRRVRQRMAAVRCRGR